MTDVTNNNINNKHSVQEVQGVTLGESNTDTGSCDSLLEIVNYLDSGDYSFDGNFDGEVFQVTGDQQNGVAKSESENCGVTVGDVSDKNVDMPEVSVITHEKFSSGLKRSSSVRSDVSDHIISQFLDRSVDDVGFFFVCFVIAVSLSVSANKWKR